MTKKPKKVKMPYSSGSSLGISGEWKDTWKKIAAENQKTIAQYMQDSELSPSPWLNKSLFNLGEVTDTFTQSMRKLSEQGDSTEVHIPHLVDIYAFLHSTLDRFQKRPGVIKRRPILQSSSRQTTEGDENPFFFLLQQSYLLNVQFVKEAVSQMARCNPAISRKLTFYAHQLVESLSLTNQPVIDLAFSQDSSRFPQPRTPKNLNQTSMRSKMAFQAGKDLGATPGKVIFQNELLQLIQYEPLTKQVARRPLLMVPPWTNKYYIFDLNPENSFVRWALESDLTIFVVSWANPDERHAQKTIESYVLDGLKEALDQVCEITDQREVNAVGYCAGGTLLACLMGYLRAKKDTRLASATFLATPFDFSKVDELGIYRFENQRNKSMEQSEEKKHLEEQYMIQALNLLRVNDLIWSSDVNHYLLRQEPFPFDMLYWMCDSLRIPAQMHHTYLRKILIENCLKTPKGLSIAGVPIDIHKISTPLFIMAAHEDHIVPWRSVYPLTQMTEASSQKFILSASGHVTSVFNHPSRQKYHYWTADAFPESAEDWFKDAKKHKGSWWEEWRQWLESYGGGVVPARIISPGRILEDAPGSYIKKARG